jgi:hypothetical protein
MREIFNNLETILIVQTVCFQMNTYKPNRIKSLQITMQLFENEKFIRLRLILRYLGFTTSILSHPNHCRLYPIFWPSCLGPALTFSAR